MDDRKIKSITFHTPAVNPESIKGPKWHVGDNARKSNNTIPIEVNKGRIEVTKDCLTIFHRDGTILGEFPSEEVEAERPIICVKEIDASTNPFMRFGKKTYFEYYGDDYEYDYKNEVVNIYDGEFPIATHGIGMVDRVWKKDSEVPRELPTEKEPEEGTDIDEEE